MGEKSLVVDLSDNPYTIVENALLECRNLSIYEKMVLIMLKKCSGQTMKAYPGIKTIAGWTGCCDRQVQKCLRNLESKDLIQVIPRTNTSNIYIIAKLAYDGASIMGKWSETPELPVNLGGELHSPRGESCSPGSESGAPPGESHSPKKYNRKIPLKNLHLKSSSSCAEDMTTNLADEWENQFNQKLPMNKTSALIKAADYMLYLNERGELNAIERPLAYLKSMIKQGFPETGWPAYAERSALKKKNQQAAIKKQDQIEQKRDILIKLRERWQAISETEKAEWISIGKEKTKVKVISDDTKGFMAWSEAQR